MTFAPPTIIAAMHVMTGHGYANSGIVGDTAHAAKGVSYHLGKSQLIATAYSIRYARDKVGLSEAASAMDISRGSHSAAALHEWSRWLAAQCKAGAPGTRDIREVIYTPDGKVVKRWDNYAKTSTSEGDDTHLWHTHISFPRDSETRNKTALFESYFTDIPPPPGGDVPTPSSYIPGYTATIKATANVRSAPNLTASVYRVTTGETWNVTCWEKGQVDPADGSDQWLAAWSNASKRWEYTAHSNVTTGPTAPTGDCSAEVKAATAPLNAQIAQLQTDVANAAHAGAQAEWDRQSTAATVAVELAPRP